MTSFLRELSADRQIGLLFIVVFGLLLLATTAVFFMRVREGDANQRYRDDLRHYRGLLRNSWIMVAIFWLAWVTGEVFAIILFAWASFFALREFITLSPTKRGDHRSLILAFFVILPLQYILVGTEHFDLFTVMIPVYAFLALPVVSALANDSQRFLERNAKLQWGVMVCVYGMSHVPALLLLDFGRGEGRGAFLVFWLVFVVQGAMLIQHLIARKLRYLPAAPRVSVSFSWRTWGYGMFFGAVIGALLSGITPLAPGQGFALGFIACASATLGHLVMKALKRDRGVKHWGGHLPSTTGATGLLDKVDGLCFAAPVFFHSVRWYFGM
jgi:phosphatidate cytidylyltransferase